jgi:hypothetical protein
MGDNCLDCAEFTCDHTRCGWKPREGPEEEAHDFSSPSHCKACMSTWIGRGVAAMEDEPPLTPEEEEEAPSDRRCTVCAGSHPQGDCVLCECDHDRSMHDIVGRWCTAEGCDCTTFRGLPLAGAEPPPPQPERRPPYVVAYSVSGHLYEVALSGDATVRAADGALVIQHHLGPVAGIVSVAPVINKESNG